MLHDEDDRREVSEFLYNAAQDFFEACWLLTSPMNASSGAGYHLQQAIENIEKAFLAWHEKPFRKVHDLAELGSLCATIDPDLVEWLAPVSRLTFFAGGGRYKRPRSGYSREVMSDYRKSVEKAVNEILSRMPEELTSVYYQHIAEGDQYLP